ncbi:MAG TPA: NAD(+)/NADH kinase, partial [Patescibacteria group bacterium]|nr:NAD(+)/NADH kinase [Patescibacteria group bacterium]
MKTCFFAAETHGAQEARAKLAAAYGHTPMEEADVIVALGGDGSMLRALHDGIRLKKPVYGMNRGSVGFLLNDYSDKKLMERLEKAQVVKLNPLRMTVTTMTGGKQ